jgi:DNA polymerase delta subunit 2
MILEDELQRIKLIPKKDQDNLSKDDNFCVGNLPTGVVCGVYGEEVAGGKFEVEDIVFPILDYKEHSKKSLTQNSSKDDLMVLMSGLGLGSDKDPMPLELAVSWLVGEAGEMSDQEKNSNVDRVVIAGNSLAECMRDRDAMSKAKYLTKDRDASSLTAVCRLDDILQQLASSVDVDLMPGVNDPTNQMMPQQPLHHCLFPRKLKYMAQ